jgi:microcystin-dependent protein
MANSAIRIPIPGSIIDAINAQNGDLLRFDQNAGNGGAFVNFKPLIQDLYPFTGHKKLDFYVSVDANTSGNWSAATALGMRLMQSPENDMRLGINLPANSPNPNPTHTLTVNGDLLVLGKNNTGPTAEILGSVSYNTTGNTIIFKTPLKSHTDQELNGVTGLNQGRILVKHTDTNTYFARIQDVCVAGEGISITGNKIISNPGDAGAAMDAFKTVQVGQNSITADGPTDILNITGSGVEITGITGSSMIVIGAVPIGGIIMWSGNPDNIPSGWVLCNGENNTPNLQGRFIIGQGNGYTHGGIGGTADASVVSHTHTFTPSANSHNHITNLNVATSLVTGPTGQSAFHVIDGLSVDFDTLSFTSNDTTLSGTISLTGGNGIGMNLPPYYVLCFIMRVS